MAGVELPEACLQEEEEEEKEEEEKEKEKEEKEEEEKEEGEEDHLLGQLSESMEVNLKMHSFD